MRFRHRMPGMHRKPEESWIAFCCWRRAHTSRMQLRNCRRFRIGAFMLRQRLCIWAHRSASFVSCRPCLDVAGCLVVAPLRADAPDWGSLRHPARNWVGCRTHRRPCATVRAGLGKRQTMTIGAQFPGGMVCEVRDIVRYRVAQPARCRFRALERYFQGGGRRAHVLWGLLRVAATRAHTSGRCITSLYAGSGSPPL